MLRMISSERLTFRKFTAADRALYKSWYMNDEVMRYITGKGLTDRESDLRFQKALLINESEPALGFFAAHTKDSDTFIGLIKLVWFAEGQLEVGYGMFPEFWNRGYASEMLNAIIEYARQINVTSLLGVVQQDHAASKHVLEKFHFVLDRSVNERGVLLDHYILSIPKIP